MITYLFSIVFFIYVLLKGVGEPGVKAKVLVMLAVCVAGYDIYEIFLGAFSNSFFINLLLCIIPGIVLFIGTIVVFDDETTSNGDNSCSSEAKIDKSYYKVNITDNELSHTRSEACSDDVGFTKLSEDDENDAPLRYKNAKIDGFGTCDVEEKEGFIKITMKADGKEYEFYVKGPNIVAYRIEGKGNPQSY